MAIAIVLAPAITLTVGRELVVTGSGFTHSGNVELNIYGAGANLSVKPIIAADGGGALTTVGKLTIKPWAPGKLYVEAKDVTAGTKVTASVRVSSPS